MIITEPGGKKCRKVDGGNWNCVMVGSALRGRPASPFLKGLTPKFIIFSANAAVLAWKKQSLMSQMVIFRVRKGKILLNRIGKVDIAGFCNGNDLVIGVVQMGKNGRASLHIEDTGHRVGEKSVLRQGGDGQKVGLRRVSGGRVEQAGRDV